MSITAMRQALEALEHLHRTGDTQVFDMCYAPKVIPALRTAIEQAETAQGQEPVAWMWRCKPYCDWPNWSVSIKRPADSGRDGNKPTEGYEDFPLYTTPPAAQRQWVGLTLEERAEIADVSDDFEDVVDATEAKLKEKNCL